MRSKTIDVAKGIGIFLVVLGHNWLIAREPGELFRIIYSFHVPLFFLLSGALFKAEVSFKALIFQKFDSLLKPYLVVLLTLGAWDVFLKNADPFNKIFGIIYSTGQSIAWVPMWFLPSLFVTIVFSWAVITSMRLRNNSIKFLMVIVALLMLGIFVLSLFDGFRYSLFGLGEGNTEKLMGLPFSLDLMFVSSAFFLIGYFFKDGIRDFNVNYYILMLAFFIFSLCHYFFNETMNLNYRVYGSPFISTLQALSGIYMVLFVSDIFSKISKLSRLISYIGSGSLFVLIFHGVLQGKATSKMHSIFPFDKAFGAISGLVLSIAFSLLIWEMAKRIPILSTLLLDRKKKINVT